MNYRFIGDDSEPEGLKRRHNGLSPSAELVHYQETHSAQDLANSLPLHD